MHQIKEELREVFNILIDETNGVRDLRVIVLKLLEARDNINCNRYQRLLDVESKLHKIYYGAQNG